MIADNATMPNGTTSGQSHRDVVHRLNQRYQREFDRAERLQAELNDIHQSKAWRLFAWLRGLKQKLIGPSNRRHSESARPVRLVDPVVDAPTRRVSIIIPFRDCWSLTHDLLRSLQRSTYRSFEILLVDNDSMRPETRWGLQRAARKKRTRVISAPGPFHFSRLCNQGADSAKGEFLLFLNNDMEVLSPDWIEQLLSLAQRPDVGIVGAMLYYPDGAIQHAGIFPSDNDVSWTHLYRGRPGDYPGEHGELLHAREVPAVTGACLMIQRNLFCELGGFSDQLPVTGNDVDLCMRIRQRGLAVAITPHARLLHYESLSRGYSVDDKNGHSNVAQSSLG